MSNIILKHYLTDIQDVQAVESQNESKYVFPTLSVCFTVNINGGEYWAIYQCGQSHYHNDYSTPSNQLAISADGGTSPIITQIDMLYASDFDSKETIDDLLENYGDEHIKTFDDVLAVYNCLCENHPKTSEYVSLELDDYEEDEDGFLSLK